MNAPCISMLKDQKIIYNYLILDSSCTCYSVALTFHRLEIILTKDAFILWSFEVPESCELQIATLLPDSQSKSAQMGRISPECGQTEAARWWHADECGKRYFFATETSCTTKDSDNVRRAHAIGGDIRKHPAQSTKSSWKSPRKLWRSVWRSLREETTIHTS